MSDESTSSPQAPSSGFVRKTVLLVLLEVAAALGLYLLFRYRTDLPLLNLNVLLISLLGLVAGLATRIVLYKRNFFIRFVTGTAALILGMLLLGLLTNWHIGFGPIILFREEIDWIDLARLSIGILCFFLTMQAWWKKPVPAIVTAPVPVVVTAIPEPPTPPRVKTKRKPAKHPHFPTVTTAKGKSAAVKRVTKSLISKKISKPATKPRRSLFHHKPQVHLSKIERHICPYCLEPVTRNDPRGVVECDICHTLHHGDCWAIAGVCQVPHYTA